MPSLRTAWTWRHGPSAEQSHELLVRQCVVRAKVGRQARWSRLVRVSQQWLARRELQDLNDALSATPLAGRYWICGGLLLGWAREGRVLSHDAWDFDFYLRAEDAHLLAAATGALRRAGFKRLYRFRNATGLVTEYAFVRHGARFEFFLLFETARSGTRTYFLIEGGEEIENEIADQPLEEFDFLGRKWLKPRFHEQHLAETYGEWQVPDKGWSARRAPCVVAIRPCPSRSIAWISDDAR